MANDVLIRIKVDADGRPIGALSAQIDNLSRSTKNAGGASRDFISQLTSTGAGLRNSELNAKLFAERLGTVGVQAQKSQSAISGLVSSIQGSGFAKQIAGLFAAQGIINFTTSIKDAAVQYEKTIRTLEFATGSAQSAGKAYEFARGEASRLGVTVSSVAESYSRFAAAAKGTAVSAEDVRTVFTGVISASRALGLATTDVDRTFRAFTQIIAKGKVTAEEFRGQIGDALPVATAAAAQALGVTTTEFSRMLDAGELTLDFLPKLGAELQKQFGQIAAESTDGLSASISKLSNSWNALQLSLANNGGTDVAVGALSVLSAIADTVAFSISNAGVQIERLRERGYVPPEEGGRSFADIVAEGRENAARVARGNQVPGRTGLVQQGRAFLTLESERQNLDALQKQRDEAAKKEESAAGASIKRIAGARKAAVSEAASEAKKFAAEAAAFLKKAQEQEIERVEELRAALDEEQEARDRVRTSIKDQIAELGIEAEALRLGGAEGIRYATVQRETAKALADGVEITEELTRSIGELADAQAAAFESAEFIQAQKEAQEDLRREFERTSETLTTSITDALLRGFENGKSIAENFKETLINLFKTLVLRPVIEAIVKPVAQIAQQAIGSVIGGGSGGLGGLLGVGSTALGLLGSQGAAAAGQAIPTLAGGAGGGFLSGVGSVSQLLSGLSSLIATPQIGAQAAIIAQELVGGLFGQAAGSTAAGLAGAAFGNVGFGALGGIIASLAGIGKGADPTANFLLQGAGALGGAALGAQFGSFGGPIGAALGAIIGALASSAIPATPPRGFQSADFSSGTLRINKAGKKGFDAGSLDPIVNQLIDSLTEVDKALDLGLVKKKIKFFVGFHGDDRGFRANVGGKDVDFGNEPGASGRVQGAIFKEELLAALPDKERTKFQETVLERAFTKQNDTLKEQLESIQKDIGVQTRLKDFVKVVNFDPRTEEIKKLKKELTDLGADFRKLRGEARELGLDTEKAERAFKKTKRRLRDQILGKEIQDEAENLGAQQQAYQLAGKAIPFELQQAGLIAQFKVLGISFRELGLDTALLDSLLGEALRNLEENVRLADQQARLTAIARPFQLAGRAVPLDLQEAGIRFEFALIGDQFRELGLDASWLSGFLAEAIANLHEAEQAAQDAAQSRAYQLAGRQVPIALQEAQIRSEFQQLQNPFSAAAESSAREAAEARARAAAAWDEMLSYGNAADNQNYLAALAAAEAAEAAAAEAAQNASEFAALLAQLMDEALRNLEQAREQARVSAISRAYQLAGREVPEAIQIAGLRVEFDALRELFIDLGLDTGILAELLQAAIANVNKAAQDAGGFIGFLDEFGRVVDSLPGRQDISMAANDGDISIPFGVRPFATGARNRIVTRPELFLAGERGPESVNVQPLSGGGGSNVNIVLNGPAIFDDITQSKFTRAIGRQLDSRRLRFG